MVWTYVTVEHSSRGNSSISSPSFPYNQPHLDIIFSKHKVLLASVTKMFKNGANFKHRKRTKRRK